MDKLSKAIYCMEDFYTFRDVQIKKYNNNKKGRVTPKTPEWDMIIDLIEDYWCDLLATGYLNKKSETEKNIIFKSVTIIFPYNQIPSAWIDGIDYVDFASF